MLRLALSPKWWLWHVLTLGAMATCAFLAAWQWGRAGSAMGSALNVGYGLQWPLFAIFFGYMWWRFLRLEARRLAGEDVDEQVQPPAEADPVQEVHEPSPAVASPVVVTDRELDAGESPFGVRRPAEPVDTAEDEAHAAYNRMLAMLAERDESR